MGTCVLFNHNEALGLDNYNRLIQIKFIIIGVMKCGTSATSTFLRQHSKLFDMGSGFLMDRDDLSLFSR